MAAAKHPKAGQHAAATAAQSGITTQLEGLRQKVFLDRYSIKDDQGRSMEEYPEQMWRRVAAGIASVEATEELRAAWTDRFYTLLRDFKFVPGGRILSGAGTDAEVTCYNCFVIPSPEDSRSGIMDNVKTMIDIMARGGGVGVNLSSLRPRGSHVKTVNGTSSGPVPWGELYTTATGKVVQQGGSRRGALMLMLDDNHPDIEEFITAKAINPRTNKPDRLEYANISVAVSDAFMEAVKRDADWQLTWGGKVFKTVKARYLWELICEMAWKSADPGLVFIDRVNKLSPTYYFEDLRCVNPCGEQPLPAWGVCNLGAINLASFVHDGVFDYAALAQTSRDAMRFLDNVVDYTHYFNEENRRAQQFGARRTGLGTMGLADALIKLQVAYGGLESLDLVDRIFSTIRDAAYEASSDIAAEKGAFPSFDRDKHLTGPFVQDLPAPVKEKVRAQGLRNAVLLTQAPTGTTSLLAGVSSGIEPVYDFVMKRTDRIGEHIIYHPLLQEWTAAHPGEEVPAYFVGAKDLTPEEHVMVQARVQKYTDASISKCVVGDTLVAGERGLLPIADLHAGEDPDTFRSLALRVASLGGPQTASHFYFGGVRPTHRVRLADGHEVTGTPNHRLYVGTAEGLAWKPLDELEPGDYVALKLGAQAFGPDVSLRGFAQSVTRAGCQKTITVPASMNPMLAHFIGAYTAESSISHFTVRITNNEPAVLDSLKEEARVLFGLEGVVAPHGKHKALTLSINSKSLCELLRFLGCQTGAAQKVIPWSILQSSRASVLSFLSGLYLDGYVTAGKVAICLASQRLIQQLQIVLDNLGVQSWCSVKHNTVYHRDYYELNAHGQEGQRLGRLLAFDEVHKRERARALLQRTFAHSKSDVIPIEARTSVFAQASSAVRYRHHNYSQALSGAHEGRRLSWFGLRRLANDPQIALPPALQEVWNESLHFRRVIAVDDAGDQPVYDLTVPATEAFVANGIVNHNTANAPFEHTVEDVQRLYMLAYDLGCKGVTYYRDGSRDAVLTSVSETPAEPQAAPAPAAPRKPATVKPRPAVLHGYTRNVKAPEGTANITINSDEEGPLEIFLTVGRAGSDIAALAEALGRLISLTLRLPSDMSPQDRLREVANQLRGIGGSRSIGFGPQRVLSLPDAVAQALSMHLTELAAEPSVTADALLSGASAALPSSTANGNATGAGHAKAAAIPAATAVLTGNICPSCGSSSAFVFEEGCRKCHNCGYSEC